MLNYDMPHHRRDHNSRQKLAIIRMDAVKRVLAGERAAEVAEELGFHRSSLYSWLAAYKKQGKAGLCAKPISGRPQGSKDNKEQAQVSNGNKAVTQKQSLSSNPTPIPSTLEGWILLLNQSLLDTYYPLNTFLSVLARHLGTQGAHIMPNLQSTSSPVRPVYEGLNLDAMISMNKAITRTWQDNPFLHVLKKPGDIAILRKLISEQDWLKHPYSSKLASTGVKDAIALAFAGTEGTLSGQLVYTYRKSGFTKGAVELLLQLRPHLEVATAIAVNQWRNIYTLNALEEATDHLNIAAVVVDGDGRIVKFNNAASTDAGWKALCKYN